MILHHTDREMVRRSRDASGNDRLEPFKSAAGGSHLRLNNAPRALCGAWAGSRPLPWVGEVGCQCCKRKAS